MHSILESDGATSDPYEVLCHMGILIIEGRTPKAVGDAIASSEPTTKSAKPYNEGPHCPNFMKLYNKDTQNVHKCTENNMFCIRYNNLKQTLLNFQSKSPSICIEVSLGPDCLCGELRSQSTLVSSQPSKRDVVLEQWTITVGHKQIQEPSSQMSVMNLYQAVRSLLHFSQLTAWYMSNNGMKPAHVIYRVGVPEDSTFIGDENFVSHDFPVADVNKTVWMKISVKTLPRMEKIPSVYCPQHPNVLVDAAQCCSHFDGKEPAKVSKEKVYLSPEVLHSKFSTEAKEELLESKLPLKFQGVRKKTSEVQERKRKKHITLYGSPPSLEFQNCSVAEFLDGIPVDVKKSQGEEYFGGKRMFQRESLKSYQGESSKAEYKKPKSSVFPTELSELVKAQSDFGHFDSYSCNYFEQKVVDPTLDLMIGLNSLSDSRRKSEFRTKGKSKANALSSSVDSNSDAAKKKEETKTVMDILDDRMQISCAISGKHHCKWECEEENDLCNSEGNVEKPKRRRSLSKVGINDGSDDGKGVSRGSPDLHFPTGFETEKILHGKFKEVDGCKLTLKEKYDEEEGNEPRNPKALFSFPSCSQVQDHQSLKTSFWESPPKPNTYANVDISCNNLSHNTFLPETPISSSLPLESGKSEKDGDSGEDAPESSERFVEKVADEDESGSSRRKPSPEAKKSPLRALTWVRTESLEAFKKGCAIASTSAAGYSSDSEAEFSDGCSETSNPFLAAILRTTKKSKNKSAVKKDSRTQKICDSILKEKVGQNVGKEEERSDKHLGKRGLFLEKLKYPVKSYVNEKVLELKAKVEGSEKQQSNSSVTKVPFSARDSTGSDLKSEDDDSDVEYCSTQSLFSSESLSRVDCHFDKQDLKQEERPSDSLEYLFEESGNSNANSTKTIPVPSAHDKLKFRRSLDSAAQLVFHRCSGLPLTSSPAPVRRNNSSFSFDSSLNSVSAIKSALFEPSNSLSSEDENESEGSLKSPASPGAWSVASKQINYHSLSPLPLLGSFEESVLNGRLEPVSTVHGFTAELGASGSFCPPHLYLPVTVFFYTLGDNDKVSAPYLGHINLGKKGYNVPRSGTIQVTLFNPLRTVVKMFVVVYDLHDMPVNSHTFLRQRTLYVPASQKESSYTDKKETPFEQEDYHKYLRYLIHLRFVSGKTGRIYLHTDIRMVIFRKADEDTATALGNQSDGETYELRSHTHGPMNPKFSPRK